VSGRTWHLGRELRLRRRRLCSQPQLALRSGGARSCLSTAHPHTPPGEPQRGAWEASASPDLHRINRINRLTNIPHRYIIAVLADGRTQE
jgi:hypothetical protein